MRRVAALALILLSLPLAAQEIDCLELSVLRSAAIAHVKAERGNGGRQIARVIRVFRGERLDVIQLDVEEHLRANREYLLMFPQPLEAEAKNRPFRIIPLDELEQFPQIRIDKWILRDRSAVFKAVEAAVAAAPPNPDVESIPLFMWADSGRREGFPPLFPPAGGYLYVRIPRDARTLDLALEWATSPDMSRRVEACDVLARFDDPRSIAALELMLRDTGAHTVSHDLHSRPGYIVRIHAYEALRRLGRDVARPRIDLWPWPLVMMQEHPMAALKGGLLLIVPPALLILVRRARRRRGMWLEKWSIGRLLFDAIALASFVAALFILQQWWQSRHGGSALSLRSENRRAWLIDCHGGLLTLARTLRDDADWPGADWGFSRGAGAWWFGNVKSWDERFNYAGVRVESAPIYEMTLAGVKAVDQKLRIKLPLWMPLVLAMLLPAWWMKRQFYFAKRRRRARRGWCISCGYDLRASGDRCPECGAATSRPPATAPRC